MKSILYFALTLFLEITCGLILYVLYYLFSTLIFDHGGINVIYYLLMIPPPTIFCWTESRRLKQEGDLRLSKTYLLAALIYFAGGSLFLYWLI